MLVMLKHLTTVLIAGLLLAAAATASVPAHAQACTSSWSGAGYKSYAQIKQEVGQRLGNARILRVELCGSGASAYFRVVAIVGSTREELRISAR